MQKILISLAAITLVIFAGYCGYVLWANSAQKVPYAVAQKWDNKMELRTYPPLVMAEVRMDKDFKTSGNEAFRLLFDYISGENTGTSEIAMTAPVVQTQENLKIEMTSPVLQSKPTNGAWVVAFILPSEYTLETAPQPANPIVELRQTEPHETAAIRFSGSWSKKHFDKKAAQLAETLETKGIKFKPTPIIARYNPPFTPPFLRRNEVMYELMN